MVFFHRNSGYLQAVDMRCYLPEQPWCQSEVFAEVLDSPPIKALFRLLCSSISFCYISVVSGMNSFAGYGPGFWIASFFIRT